MSRRKKATPTSASDEIPNSESELVHQHAELRKSFEVLTHTLEVQKKDLTDKLERAVRKNEQWESSYEALRAEFAAQKEFTALHLGKTPQELEEMAENGEDDPEDDEPLGKELTTDNKMPRFKKKGTNWGPFPAKQYSFMLLVLAQMHRMKLGSLFNHVTVYPATPLSCDPEDYLLLPFVPWCPLKLFGVMNPRCPRKDCTGGIMVPKQWNDNGGRYAWTLSGPIIILCKVYRCNTCGKTKNSTSRSLLDSWPPAVRAAFPFVAGKFFYVEERLLAYWLRLYTTCNLGCGGIAATYNQTIADVFYRQVMTYLQRSVSWTPSLGLSRSQMTNSRRGH